MKLDELYLEDRSIAAKLADTNDSDVRSKLLDKRDGIWQQIESHPDFMPSTEHSYGVAYGTLAGVGESPKAQPQ